MPAEFTRMKISVTVSMSRSSASSITPTWLLMILRRLLKSYRKDRPRQTPGLAAAIRLSSSAEVLADGSKTSATSGIQAASFSMAGFQHLELLLLRVKGDANADRLVVLGRGPPRPSRAAIRAVTRCCPSIRMRLPADEAAVLELDLRIPPGDQVTDGIAPIERIQAGSGHLVASQTKGRWISGMAISSSLTHVRIDLDRMGCDRIALRRHG